MNWTERGSKYLPLTIVWTMPQLLWMLLKVLLGKANSRKAKSNHMLLLAKKHRKRPEFSTCLQLLNLQSRMFSNNRIHHRLFRDASPIYFAYSSSFCSYFDFAQQAAETGINYFVYIIVWVILLWNWCTHLNEHLMSTEFPNALVFREVSNGA